MDNNFAFDFGRMFGRYIFFVAIALVVWLFVSRDRKKKALEKIEQHTFGKEKDGGETDHHSEF